MFQTKKWIIAESVPQDWQNKFPELPLIHRQLLWNRGLRSQEAVDEFLNPDYSEDLHDPFLFKDMEKAVERIFLAIQQKEKIAIYGDYDTDGVSGSVILEVTLKALGAEISEVHLPHREKEGYGLNKEAVSHLVAIGSKLIITCDCGIANYDEVAFAQEQGVDVIITDHHHIPQKVPPAFAILHPFLPDSGYPFLGLTGGGVAYKLACGLIKRLRTTDYRLQKVQNTVVSSQLAVDQLEGFEKWLLDLVAISTVADVGKLIGENRTLVKYGLVVLKKTRRLGLQKLYEVAGIKPENIDTWSIAFQITPRINAAGRMNHANTAYRLLMSENEGEAKFLSTELNQANAKRQYVTDEIIEEAKDQIGEIEGKYFLSAFDEKWSVGVIGLVAGKLSDEFCRPVMIGSKNESGKIIGSARSIEQFNIIDAFKETKDLMIKFGGHPKAAGFTLEGIGQWRALTGKLEEIAKKQLAALDLRPAINIDAEISLNQIDWDFWRNLQLMEPFGEGNPRPRFLAKNLEVIALEQVGNEDKHLRLTVTEETRKPYKMIGFCFGNWCERLTIGDKIEVVFELGVNEWNGNQELQFKIIDIKNTMIKIDRSVWQSCLENT